MTRNDYEATREIIRDILTPFNQTEIRSANKAIKKFFGDRLYRIRPVASCEYSYEIACEEDGSWIPYTFTWDFFYGTWS